MTEKQRDMKYLHKYNALSDFDNDYNGEYYHEPWVSISPSLTVTGLTMEDVFIWSEGATWEYECERDAVDMEGPMGTQHVYEWTWYDTGSSAQLHAATLVRNPSVGTQIYESGENDGEWFFASTNPANVVTVSGTTSERPDKVTYNKRGPEEKYIRIEATLDSEGTWTYIVTDSNLTCEDLEASGNTYKAYMTTYEYENPEVIESECDLTYNRYDQELGAVWTPAECDNCCFVGCGDGELYAWYEG